MDDNLRAKIYKQGRSRRNKRAGRRRCPNSLKIRLRSFGGGIEVLEYFEASGWKSLGNFDIICGSSRGKSLLQVPYCSTTGYTFQRETRSTKYTKKVLRAD